MDKKSYETLRTIDTSELAFSLASRLRDNESSVMYHCKSVVIAYALYMATEYSVNDFKGLDDFVEATNIPSKVKSVLVRHADSVWEIVKDLNGKYPPDDLLAFILFNGRLQEWRLFHTVEHFQTCLLNSRC